MAGDGHGPACLSFLQCLAALVALNEIGTIFPGMLYNDVIGLFAVNFLYSKSPNILRKVLFVLIGAYVLHMAIRDFPLVRNDPYLLQFGIILLRGVLEKRQKLCTIWLFSEAFNIFMDIVWENASLRCHLFHVLMMLIVALFKQELKKNAN